MPYIYKKIKRLITVGSNPGEKFLAAIANQGRITTDQLMAYVQSTSSISEQDITLLFRSLAKIIKENVEMGRGVNLQDLGVFLPGFKSNGELNIDDVSADNIEKVTVGFRPAPKFRDEIKKAGVEETTKFRLKHEVQS